MKKRRTLISRRRVSTQVSDLSKESNEIKFDSDREENIFISIETKIYEIKEEEMMDS